MMAERLTCQQRQHKDKIEEKFTYLPSFIDEYKDGMYTGNTSPSTLLGYIHDFETFFRWLMREGIVVVEHMKDISLSALEHLRFVEANAFFTHLSMERELQEELINRKKSSRKSLLKFLTTRTEDGECYFYRNVMAKVKMAKTSETLSSRAECISNKEEVCTKKLEHGKLHHSFTSKPPLTPRNLRIYHINYSHRYNPSKKSKWQPGSQIIPEAVASRAENNQVRLVTNG